MADQNQNLSPKQFLHASDHPFKPGDMVEPGHESNWSQSSSQHVYAAKYGDRAMYYRDHLKDEKGSAHVYNVEPTGPVTRDPGDKDAVRSKSPMKVTGRAVYMPPEPTFTKMVRDIRARNKAGEGSSDPYKALAAKSNAIPTANYGMLDQRRSSRGKA